MGGFSTNDHPFFPRRKRQPYHLKVELFAYDGPADPDTAQSPRNTTSLGFIDAEPFPFTLTGDALSITRNTQFTDAQLDEDSNGRDDFYAEATIIADIKKSEVVQKEAAIVSIDNPNPPHP